MTTTHAFHKPLLLGLALGASLLLSPGEKASACTGITLTAADKTYVPARSIEWGESKLDSRLVVSGRGRSVQTQTAYGAGMRYETRYGFAGVRIFKDAYVVEGLNEKGLSAGLFFFPGSGGYPQYRAELSDQTISDMEFVAWLLANFDSVKAVRQAAPGVRIAAAIAQAGTLHYRAADASGEQIVIEIVGGEMKIYDNPLGVLTNSPDFPWQTANLNNYLNLRTGPSAPVDWGGTRLRAFGMGTGLLGLPGDISPASRFVRAALMQTSAPELKDAREAVLYGFTILSSFEIPIGLELSNPGQKTDLMSATQWSSASDTTHRVFYYRTADNPRLRKLDLNAVDFSSARFDSLPLDKESEEPFETLDID